MSLTTCVAAAVAFALFPLGGLPGQQGPQVPRVDSRAFFGGVNVHLRDAFATRWVPPGARELGASVRYHVPLTEIELFAEGRRRPLSRQAYDGAAVRTQFDVFYSAGLSLRLPF